MGKKTAELTGPALDWAVCEAESLNAFGFEVREGKLWTLCSDREYWKSDFSSNWAQGGPIIEREFITIDQKERSICACIDAPEGCELNDIWANGPTPLIAAMRCYVASKLGDTVDIPEELT
jgi:hypothetical protein